MSQIAMDGARIVNGKYPALGAGRDITVGITKADDIYLAAYREVFSDLFQKHLDEYTW